MVARATQLIGLYEHRSSLEYFGTGANSSHVDVASCVAVDSGWYLDGSQAVLGVRVDSRVSTTFIGFVCCASEFELHCDVHGAATRKGIVFDAYCPIRHAVICATNACICKCILDFYKEQKSSLCKYRLPLTALQVKPQPMFPFEVN